MWCLCLNSAQMQVFVDANTYLCYQGLIFGKRALWKNMTTRQGHKNLKFVKKNRETLLHKNPAPGQDCDASNDCDKDDNEIVHNLNKRVIIFSEIIQWRVKQKQFKLKKKLRSLLGHRIICRQLERLLQLWSTSTSRFLQEVWSRTCLSPIQQNFHCYPLCTGSSTGCAHYCNFHL